MTPEVRAAFDAAESHGHHLVHVGADKYKCTSCDASRVLTVPELGELAETCNPRRESRTTRFHMWLQALEARTTPKKDEAPP